MRDFSLFPLVYPLAFSPVICQHVDMQIPIGDSRVVNSRFFRGQNVIWRRRQTKDGIIYTTRERIDLSQKVVIKRPPKAQEGYQPAKLLFSLVNSLNHRPDALSTAWGLLTTVENRLLEEMSLLEQALTSKMIAESVLETLKGFDIDAYIVYARYHPDLVSKEELRKSILS